jgi:predicted kinase
MMGLPRSGKSTLAAKLREKGVPTVNGDSVRLALHGQRFVQEAEQMVHAINKIMVRALFIAGHDVVCVDETNIRRSIRDGWKKGDWATAFWDVGTPKEVCLERARAANDDVIQPVIERMASQFEPLGDDEQRFSPDA